MPRNWSVVRAHSHAALMIDTCAWGLLAGWIYSFVPLPALWMPWAFSVLTLAPLLLVVAALTRTRQCWHFGMHALRGCLIGIAVGSALMVAVPRQEANWPPLDRCISFFALPALLGALSCVLLLWARTAFIGSPIVQDGTRCPKCAYVVANLPNNRCPECGGEFTASDIAPVPPTFRPDWLRAAKRLVVCVALFALLYIFYPYVLTRLAITVPGPLFLTPGYWHVAVMRYINRQPAAASRVFASLLEDPDPLVRVRSANLVYLMDRPGDQLVQRLADGARNDPDSLARQTCLCTLGSQALAERLDGLMTEFLQDPDWEIRWTALASLSSGGSRPRRLGTPWLIIALDDPDAQVRSYSYQRLCDNTRRRFPFDPNAPRDERLRQQAVWQEWWKASAPLTK